MSYWSYLILGPAETPAVQNGPSAPTNTINNSITPTTPPGSGVPLVASTTSSTGPGGQTQGRRGGSSRGQHAYIRVICYHPGCQVQQRSRRRQSSPSNTPEQIANPPAAPTVAAPNTMSNVATAATRTTTPLGAFALVSSRRDDRSSSPPPNPVLAGMDALAVLREPAEHPHRQNIDPSNDASVEVTFWGYSDDDDGGVEATSESFADELAQMLSASGFLDSPVDALAASLEDFI